MEDVIEFKNGKKQVVSKKVFPGYLLVRLELDDDSWGFQLGAAQYARHQDRRHIVRHHQRECSAGSGRIKLRPHIHRCLHVQQAVPHSRLKSLPQRSGHHPAPFLVQKLVAEIQTQSCQGATGGRRAQVQPLRSARNAALRQQGIQCHQ